MSKENGFELTAFASDGTTQIGKPVKSADEKSALKDAHDLLHSDDGIKKVVIEKGGKFLCAVN